MKLETLALTSCIAAWLIAATSYAEQSETRNGSINASRTTLTGIATWYSRASCRREKTGGLRILMANGRPLRDNAMTRAMWTIGKNGRPLKPDGRTVKVTNVTTGKIIQVAWADNGPGYASRRRGVIIDLSEAAMILLSGKDGIKAGRVKVRVEPL